GDIVVLNRSTTTVVVSARQDSKSALGKYPIATKIISGEWLVFLPYLAVKSSLTTVDYIEDRQRVRRVIDGCSEPAPDNTDGDEFIRVANRSTNPAATWVSQAVAEEVAAAEQYFRRLLGKSINRPALYISVNESGDGLSLAGEVPNSSQILLIFRGKQWREPT